MATIPLAPPQKWTVQQLHAFLGELLAVQGNPILICLDAGDTVKLVARRFEVVQVGDYILFEAADSRKESSS